MTIKVDKVWKKIYKNGKLIGLRLVYWGGWRD